MYNRNGLKSAGAAGGTISGGAGGPAAQRTSGAGGVVGQRSVSAGVSRGSASNMGVGGSGGNTLAGNIRATSASGSASARRKMQSR